MVEFEIGPATDWTPGVGGHGAVLAFSWLSWQHGEIKSRRDGSRTGNHHFILKKVKFYSRPGKKSYSTSSFLQEGRHRLLFDGLVLQEDAVVRGRCFSWLIRRRDRTGVQSFAES